MLKEKTMDEKNHACENTDIELWRKIEDDYYSPSIHVTKFDGIGINVEGHVLVAPIEKWHEIGNKLLTVNPSLTNPWNAIPRWKRKIAFWLLGWSV